MSGRKYELYCDNCAIHKTLAVREWAAEEGIEFVMGVPYCPQYCAIETFWSGAKRSFKRLGTKVILAGQPREYACPAMA